MGVGASRVRDLFKQAKEAAPAIVFIDELDAIGRSRSGNVRRHQRAATTSASRRSTRSSPRWTASSRAPNVIVLGATNRPEILDPALLRPGRFDRRIAVNPPDRTGRVAILKIHTRDVPLADDVDLERIAASIPGSTGADIALLVNEAALFAARHDHAKVEQRDFTDVDREDPPRRRAADRDDRRRPQAHRLPRVRPRAGRHAHPGRRPGAEDLDHPPRPGARRHPLDAGERPLQLPPRGAPGADQGRARRPRRGEGRLRRPLDRRRVRHPEPHPGRPRHGRALGNERRDRPDRRHRRPRRTDRCCPARSPPPSRPRSWSTRRSAGSSTRPRDEVIAAARAASATASRPSPTRCSSARRSTSPRPTRSPACRCPRPTPSRRRRPPRRRRAFSPSRQTCRRDSFNPQTLGGEEKSPT